MLLCSPSKANSTIFRAWAKRVQHTIYARAFPTKSSCISWRRNVVIMVSSVAGAGGKSFIQKFGTSAATMPETNAYLPLVEQIDERLPQTQCGQCGFDGCRPYAVAIVEKTALINRCP